MRRPGGAFAVHTASSARATFALGSVSGHGVADDSDMVWVEGGHAGGGRARAHRGVRTEESCGVRAALDRFEPFDRPGQGDARTVYLPEEREAVPHCTPRQGLERGRRPPGREGPLWPTREAALPERRRRPSDPPAAPPPRSLEEEGGGGGRPLGFS